jgi:hypothetical protein
VLYKTLTYTGSLITIGFGIWHFFVPTIWKWYSYMDDKATELVLAVRATNVFFSLSLVLFGLLSIVLISSSQSSRHTIIVILAADIILWLTRVVLQIMSPQGTMNFYLQYGMLASFILVLLLYGAALALYWKSS